MPTLPNMGLVTPTLGADSGQWDGKINAAFGLTDAHDHTSGKGVSIRTAAISINADLPMGGFGLTALGKLSFSTIAAPVSGSKNLFVNSADNELYWRSNAGTNVKLTSGASINTTLVGGIVGDYTSVGAAVAYDDANKRYTFKTQTSTWARLASGPVRVYEYNTSESVYVELAAPGALAASYTVTFPLAVPAETVQVRMDSSGNLTVARQTKTKTVSLLGMLPMRNADPNDTSGFNLTQSGGDIFWQWPTASATSYQLYMPLELEEGCLLTTLDFYIKKNSNGSTTLAFTLYSVSTVGAMTQVATTNYNGNATGDQTVTLSAINHTFDSAKNYFVAVTINNDTPSAADEHYGCKLTYTDPH